MLLCVHSGCLSVSLQYTYNFNTHQKEKTISDRFFHITYSSQSFNLLKNICMNNYALTEKIIGSAMRVHSKLGPGLLESSYLTCLNYELTKAGLFTRVQVALPLVYDEIKLDHGYRIDLIVQNEVIVETKSVEVLAPIHEAQLLTYLKLSGLKVGLLLNFNTRHLKEGIQRVSLSPQDKKKQVG